MSSEAAVRKTDYIIIIKDSAENYILKEFRDLIIDYGLHVHIKDEKEFKEIVKKL